MCPHRCDMSHVASAPSHDAYLSEARMRHVRERDRRVHKMQSSYSLGVSSEAHSHDASAMRGDNKKALAREHKATRCTKSPACSPKHASDERWLTENIELRKSTDRKASLACVKQRLPVKEPANSAKSAKQSLLQVGPGTTAPPSPPPGGPDEFRSSARPNGAGFLRSPGIADRSKHHERAERSMHDIRAQMLEQAKLLELVQAAVRSGHVVLVVAEDTVVGNPCSLPGRQVELLGDAPYKYLSSLTEAVTQQKDARVACAACMPVSAAYMCKFCLVVVEIVIVMYGYACLAAYLRSQSRSV